MNRMEQGPRMQCHRFFVFAVLLLGLGTFSSAQEQKAVTRLDALRSASVARGASDFTLSKKIDGVKPQVAGAGRTSVPAAAQPGISAALGRDDSRYQVRALPGGFRAENPQQELSAEFTGQGIEVRSGAAQWGLALRGYGYGDSLRAASEAAPQASANRVEYRRGPLTEWYVNGPIGLEQGFTLAERPGGSNGEPLTIALALSKGLTASLDAEGKGVTLASGEGQPKARYAGLIAYDATGREMRSWMEVRCGDLLLHVAEGDARYPLVVDPFIQLAKLTASDGAANDELGFSVSISGDGGTVVAGALHAKIGANFDQGAAYVFVKSGSGWASTSGFTAKLTASDGAGNDRFGFSVSISGDGGTVVAGAESAAIGANSFQGAAYVFVKPGSGWASTSSFDAKLTASDGAQFDDLGSSVYISGDGGTAVAGAPGVNFSHGAAYVFVKPATGWDTTSNFNAKLTASDGAANDQFGFSVAVSGDGGTVVAGAFSATIGSNSRQGAAYVFVKPATFWLTTTETAKLTASDGAIDDLLGIAVSISGDGGTVVAGAPQAFISFFRQGAAYVFLKPVTGWATETETAKLTASDGAAGDNLAFFVAISSDGGTVVAGAVLAKIGSNTFQGAVYVFVKPGTGWASTSTFDAKLVASDGAANDQLGFSVVVGGHGGTVAAGAPQAMIGSNINQGAAYVFGRSDFSISARPSSQTVEEGGTAKYTITLTPLNGFTGTVTLTCADVIVGSTCTITPSSVTLTGTKHATVKVSVPWNGHEGSFTLTFTGTSGTLVHAANVTLKVD
jgi:hypothetical protein